MKNKKFVIYTRCSTDEQAVGDFTTLDSQAHHCKNMLDAFGYELAEFGKDNKGIVRDDGYSAKDLNRPGIKSILEDINSKRSFDGIIFFRLDRLTRNPRDLYALIDLFRSKNVDFVSVRENLDSATAIGRVVIGILGLLSAFERELTGERVKASGIARAREGHWVGGAIPYGYKLVDAGPRLENGHQPHKISLDEKVAPYLPIIWKMAAANRSLTEIARELIRHGVKPLKGNCNDWRKQSIAHMIKNPFYKGFFRYAKETHRGAHETIIDEHTWEKANRVISGKIPGHKFIAKPKEYLYLLQGLLRCGKCGSYFVTTHACGHSGDKFFYYYCSRTKQGLGCNADRISAKKFDQTVIDFLRTASQDQNIIASAIAQAINDSKAKLTQLDTDILMVERNLQDAKNEASRVLALLMEGALAKGATYKTKMAELDALIASKQDDLTKLEAQRRVAQMTASSAEFLQSNICLAMKHLHKAPPAAQKQLLQLLIKTITFMEDKVELRMYIDPIDKIDLPILQNAPTAPKNTKGPVDPSHDALANTGTSGLTNGALSADGDCLSNRQGWLTR